jgi:hypothetical protein
MTELKDRFSLADEIGPRDLWGEARRRAAAPEAPPRAFEWPPALGRRLAAAAVALAVFATAAVFAWDLSHPERRPDPRPAVDLSSELPEGWSELRAPPEVRSGAATAWTGSQLLVWGGYEFVGTGDDDPDADGFAFDAATRRWSDLPESPLRGRADVASAWTGSELLVWGGWDGGFREVPFFDDGAAFDPATGAWRLLAPAPIEARTAFSVWTGEELIVWGSTDRAVRRRDGAAYDPTTNTWRSIADAPLDVTDGSAVWTGREMLVFGAALDGSNDSDTRNAIGVAYDPQADTWRELPPSDLSPQAMTATWFGDELITWDYEHASAAYDPVTDAWRALPDVPLPFSECRPVSVATSRTVFGEFCGRTVVFSPQEDAWHRDPMPVPEAEDGCCWVHEPLAAGGVVLVPSLLYDEPPARTSASDRRMFVYNPPRVVRTDARGEVLDPESFVPEVTRDGDLLRMPVVFPDASEGTLVYPIPLGLEMMGVRPDLSYSFRGRYQGRILFLHDPNASIAAYVEGTEPASRVESLRTPRRLEVWKARSKTNSPDLTQRFLVRLSLPSWTVLIAIEDDDLAAYVAAALDIWESSSGFPVVEASGDAQLNEGFGEAEGAVLSFGDGEAEDPTVSRLDAAIYLSPDGCSSGSENSGTSGSACLGDGSVFANIYGDQDFVAGVLDGLRVEDVRLPGTDVEPVPFVPQTQVIDGITRAPLTFPDGSTVTLAYPSAYGLVDHGVQPDTAYDSERTGLVPIMFVHGPAGAEGRYLRGVSPVAQAAGRNGETLPLWEAVPLHESSIDPTHWLVHRVGGWSVLVGVRDPALADDVAVSIAVHLARTGMPWIQPLGEFSLSPFAGEGGGTVLTIGDHEPSPRSQRVAAAFANFATVSLTPRACGERIEERSLDVNGENLGGTLCRADGRVIVSIYAERTFADGLLEQLNVEGYRATG